MVGARIGKAVDLRRAVRALAATTAHRAALAVWHHRHLIVVAFYLRAVDETTVGVRVRTVFRFAAVDTLAAAARTRLTAVARRHLPTIAFVGARERVLERRQCARFLGARRVAVVVAMAVVAAVKVRAHTRWQRVARQTLVFGDRAAAFTALALWHVRLARATRVNVDRIAVDEMALVLFRAALRTAFILGRVNLFGVFAQRFGTRHSRAVGFAAVAALPLRARQREAFFRRVDAFLAWRTVDIALADFLCARTTSVADLTTRFTVFAQIIGAIDIVTRLNFRWASTAIISNLTSATVIPAYILSTNSIGAVHWFRWASTAVISDLTSTTVIPAYILSAKIGRASCRERV